MHNEATVGDRSLITLTLKYVNSAIEFDLFDGLPLEGWPLGERPWFIASISHSAHDPRKKPATMVYLRVAENGGSCEIYDGDEWMPFTDALLYEELWIDRYALNLDPDQ